MITHTWLLTKINGSWLEATKCGRSLVNESLDKALALLATGQDMEVILEAEWETRPVG